MNPHAQSATDKQLISLLEGLDTAGISDAMDKLGLHGQALGIHALNNYRSEFYQKTFIGPAFTVKYVPASDPAGTVGDFIDDVAVGDVIVIDNSGRADCTVWGDIMTQYAGLRGITATVIDGVCRDVSTVLKTEYPLFTAGKFMRTGKDRVQVESVNSTVSVGNVRVEARDLVVADASGVVIIPRHRVEEVATIAKQIEASEEVIRERLRQGETLGAARKATGYHQLQSKPA